jgi:membrane protease YdiL (CAAX protease family)
MENAVTLVLATLFDIPAIYVFSVTSILIEEILFRGILLRSYAQTSGNYRSVLIVSILWTLFMISDIIGGELFDATESAVLTLYFLSVGVLVTSLSLWRGNVWFGYSLRIGLITLTPIILTSRINESDSFFNSGSLLFIAEGVVVSMVLILLAAIVLINFRKNSSISID